MSKLWSSVRKGAIRFAKVFRRHEPWMLVFVLGYVYPEYLFLVQLPEFVTNQVIAQIVPVYITVEGFLLAFGWQIKNRIFRNLFAVGLGVPTILSSVYVFSSATYAFLQGKISSTNTLTAAFQSASLLFLIFVELYAISFLVPEKLSTPRIRRRKILQRETTS